MITLTLDEYLDILRSIVEAVMLILAIAGGEYGRRKFQESLQKTAVGWPSTEGTILWAKVESDPNSLRFLVNLTYTYFVGEYRAGRFEQGFRKEWEAADFARRMRNQRIQVRYKDSDPDISIIDRASMECMFALPPATAHFSFIRRTENPLANRA